jgi:hypothetical protein
LDAVRATRSPFDPSEVVKEYSDLAKTFRATNLLGDNYGGEWPKAEFAKHGVSYELCEKSKSELYLAAIPMLTSKRVELLDIEKMKNEFRRLERRRGRSGKIQSIIRPAAATTSPTLWLESSVLCLSTPGNSLNQRHMESGFPAAGTFTWKGSAQSRIEIGISSRQLNTGGNFMRVTALDRQNAGMKLWSIAKEYQERRKTLSDKDALRLAMLSNPDVAEIYIGCAVRRDGVDDVKRFVMKAH